MCQTLRSAADMENANGTGPPIPGVVSADIQALLGRVRELASKEGCCGNYPALSSKSLRGGEMTSGNHISLGWGCMNARQSLR